MSLELITSVLTPAVMINVCALLLISTTNRNSRIRDRIRNMNNTLIHDKIDLNRDVINNYIEQLKYFKERGRLIKKAMTFNYMAFFSFVVTTLFLFFEKFLGFSIIFSVVTLLLGLVFLFAYAVILIKESRINFITTNLDAELTEKMLDDTDKMGF
ncbi:MAG: DUF2721 domain-containing protein [Candidatus Mcinerneyibacterium aminivorans]|jgi:hypothetical protein|uniref:DUF2721 domain-containing protein n=1 Tax=Candidatus Mcinerneyibacterium aminivorans TaxID=2703815 RepID=A0A5D0MKV5_9BACT|nr:MAG: DUF2721 domain-containing protein [Candidatus Mcinerneyibacterium aminivorans]